MVENFMQKSLVVSEKCSFSEGPFQENVVYGWRLVKSYFTSCHFDRN